MISSVDSWPRRGSASSNNPMVKKPSFRNGSEIRGTAILQRPRHALPYTPIVALLDLRDRPTARARSLAVSRKLRDALTTASKGVYTTTPGCPSPTRPAPTSRLCMSNLVICRVGSDRADPRPGPPSGRGWSLGGFPDYQVGGQCGQAGRAGAGE